MGEKHRPAQSFAFLLISSISSSLELADWSKPRKTEPARKMEDIALLKESIKNWRQWPTTWAGTNQVIDAAG